MLCGYWLFIIIILGFVAYFIGNQEWLVLRGRVKESRTPRQNYASVNIGLMEGWLLYPNSSNDKVAIIIPPLGSSKSLLLGLAEDIHSCFPDHQVLLVDVMGFSVTERLDQVHYVYKYLSNLGQFKHYLWIGQCFGATVLCKWLERRPDLEAESNKFMLINLSVNPLELGFTAPGLMRTLTSLFTPLLYINPFHLGHGTDCTEALKTIRSEWNGKVKFFYNTNRQNYNLHNIRMLKSLGIHNIEFFHHPKFWRFAKKTDEAVKTD